MNNVFRWMDMPRRCELFRTSSSRAPPNVVRPMAVRQNRWRNFIGRSFRESSFRWRKSRLRALLLQRRMVRIRKRPSGLSRGCDQHRRPCLHGRQHRSRGHPWAGRLSTAALWQRTLFGWKQRRRHRRHDEHRFGGRHGRTSWTSRSRNRRFRLVPRQRPFCGRRVLGRQGQVLGRPEPSAGRQTVEGTSACCLPTKLSGRSLEMLSRIQARHFHQK